jgi:CubicO group peptidase (beta-lactamase class C family)
MLTPIADTGEWPAASPPAEGLDASRLGDLAFRIRRGDYGRITSLLIARHGRLCVEEYFNGWSADRPHTLQSVTKSVTSLLVGLAVQKGRLRIDDRVTRFFPQYQPLTRAAGDVQPIALAPLQLLPPPARRATFATSSAGTAGLATYRSKPDACAFPRSSGPA